MANSAASRFLARLCAALLLALGVPAGAATVTGAEGIAKPRGAVLKDRYLAVRDRLEKNPYGRPLWLDSTDASHQLRGDAYAIVTQPFDKVQAAFTPAPNWCEVLLMPFNTKHCTAGEGKNGTRLSLYVGRKSDTPVENTFRIDFDYAPGAHARDYFEIVLKAAEGPLGTRDYRIALEATPLDDNRTFLHFSYAYTYGMLSKVAMQAYLSTAGAAKVGFTSEGRGSSGEARLVGGMRGVMERNTMRYYLAIDAFLATLDAPAGARVTQRLNDWFSATQRYPRQLDEDIGRAQYVAMKQREYARLGAPKRAEAGT